ncbi:helicase-related protein, partial [Sulfurospirillum sp.]|nr:helicase-related protein [Sulfurospirillum sp.]
PYEEIKDEDWKSFSHLFLHHLGKSENYYIMEIEKNESNKLEKILEYCIKNNIQSMFDEYFHLLTDSPRYKNIHDDKAKILYLLDNFQTIFNMGHYSVRSDDFKKNKKNIKASKFAMRISKSSMIAKGDEKLPTANNVKISFNSPFAPFILATTSIGQEGLDFHSYCHQIWHWDLPSNPVDLEQREGRINRYKNYAVRKNIAKAFNNKCWIKKFQNAKKEKGCDFTTFWIYESEVSPEKIQRVIPKMPLSREYYKYEHLKNQLKLYRGVMGQKKQNEKMITSENIDIPQISLKPPKSSVKER